MQRVLSLERSPGLSVPLRFLLTAPVFGVLAGLLLVWQGGFAFASRWTGVTLALTHLLTLGYLAMTMTGAMLQMLPVVAGVEVDARFAGRFGYPAMVAGTLALCGGFLFAQPLLFGAAVLLFVPAFQLPAWALVKGLREAPAAGARDVVAGMRAALGALALAALLGMALALFLGGGPLLPALQLTDLHAAWALLGGVAILIASVGFQVIPMFQATPAFPAWTTRNLPYIPAVLLVAWTCGFTPALPLLCAVLGAYAVGTLYLLSKRRRPQPDTTTWYWRLSLASLALSMLLAWFPGTGMLPGVLFIAGFALGAVNGMLYKIVPFLVWYHLQEAGVPRHERPRLADLLPDRQARRQFWIHAGAVALLCTASLAPVCARAGGAAFALACAVLAAQLAAPVLRCRWLLQPS
ncbi:MAG: permease [Telluria sp.]